MYGTGISDKKVGEASYLTIGEVYSSRLYMRLGAPAQINNLPDKNSVQVTLTSDVSLQEYIVNYGLQYTGTNTKVFITKVEMSQPYSWTVTVYNDSGAAFNGSVTPLIMGGLN